MIFATGCSGINACAVAWLPLGWEEAFCAEIEPFPSAVLRHRFPTIPNLGDITAHDFMARARAAIGNSKAVPVIQWIGRRIEKVEAECRDGA